MKKKILALILCALFLMTPVATIGAFAADGAAADVGYTYDETTKTYTVTTADGLIAVANIINAGNYDRNITLANDIDMEGKNWTPIGGQDKATSYKGTFNGANFTISNIFASLESADPKPAVGLLSSATDGCVVKNLKIDTMNFKGYEFVGGITGYTFDTADGTVTIDNVHIRNAKIEGTRAKYSYVGGIVGRHGANKIVVSNCTVVATVTAAGRAGGIFGGENVGSSEKNCNVEINNTLVAGTIRATNEGGNASGVFGYHSTIPLTLTNVVSLAELVVPKEDVAKGSLSFMSNKLLLTATNCVFAGNPFHNMADNSKNADTKFSNSFIYKDGETADKINVSKLGFVEYKDDNDNIVTTDTGISVNGTALKWSTAQLPTIKTKADLKTKVTSVYSGNANITAAMIEDILHDHSYTLEVANSAFLKTAATCTEKAVYYKSCSCGGYDLNATFEFGEPSGHKASDRWTYDDNNHWHICSECLEEKTDVGGHTYGEWTIKREATEKREGERVKACTECGHEVEEKIAKLTASADNGADSSADANATGDESSSGGCRSSVFGIGAVAIASVCAGALCFKKKED